MADVKDAVACLQAMASGLLPHESPAGWLLQNNRCSRCSFFAGAWLQAMASGLLPHPSPAGLWPAQEGVA